MGLHARCDAMLQMVDYQPSFRVDGNTQFFQQLCFQASRVSKIQNIGLRSECVGTVRRVQRVGCVPLFRVPIGRKTRRLSQVIQGILKGPFLFPFFVVVAENVKGLAARTLCVLGWQVPLGNEQHAIDKVSGDRRSSDSQAVDKRVHRSRIGNAAGVQPEVEYVSEHLHKVVSAAVRVDRARPTSILRRHDRKRSQQPTDVIVVYKRRVIGELANEPCVLGCIQRAIVVEKRRQHGLHERLNRLRLYRQLCR